jgi:hypothetical protein
MERHWCDVTKTFKALSYITKGLDVDGIDLYFTSDPRRMYTSGHGKSTQSLTEVVESHRSNLVEVVTTRNELERTIGVILKDRQPRRTTNVYVLTGLRDWERAVTDRKPAGFKPGHKRFGRSRTMLHPDRGSGMLRPRPNPIDFFSHWGVKNSKRMTSLASQRWDMARGESASGHGLSVQFIHFYDLDEVKGVIDSEIHITPG